MEWEQGELFEEIDYNYDFLLPPIAQAQGDNRRLLELQYEFLTTRSEKSKNDFWTFAVEIALKTVNGELKRKKLHASRDRRLEYAYDAVAYIMRRYKGGQYAVVSQYLSAIKWAVKHAIYYTTKTKLCEKMAMELMLSGVSEEKAFELSKQRLQEEK